MPREVVESPTLVWYLGTWFNGKDGGVAGLRFDLLTLQGYSALMML